LLEAMEPYSIINPLSPLHRLYDKWRNVLDEGGKKEKL